MTKVYYCEQPSDGEVVITKAGSTLYFRENIQKVEPTYGYEEEQEQWTADEYSLRVPTTANMQERFESQKEAWRTLVKKKDYDQTAKAIREIRNQLLEQTDKDMTIDRIISDIPRDPSSITAFLPFLKSLITSLSGKMAKYRQALRDVPQQEGFPYHVDWPELEGCDSDE